MSGKSINRRLVLKTGVACAVVPFVGLGQLRAQDAKLEENDPTAMALGYLHDASAVDTEKFPRRAGDAGAEMFCDTCALYTGAEGEEWGPCAIFPGKVVAAKGWCNSFAPKA